MEMRQKTFKMDLKILVFCFTILQIVNGAPEDEIAARFFIENTSDRLYELLDNLADISFNMTDFETVSVNNFDEYGHSKIEQLNAMFLKETEMAHIQEKLNEFSTLAGKFDYMQFQNEEIKLGIKQIHLLPVMTILGKDVVLQLSTIHQNLRSVITDNDLCDFKDKSKCDNSYAQILDGVIRKNNNQQELRYFWKEWRDQNKEITRDNLKQIIELVQKAAKKYGVSPSTVWFYDYLDENFLQEMEKIVVAIQPMYQEFHGFIRSILQKRFTDAMIPSGLIPHHLFEKILVKTWNPNGLLTHLFTQEDITNMKRVLRESGLTARKIIDIANDFYKSLGFEDLPIDFWIERLKTLSDSEKDEVDCRASINDLSKHIYMKYCPEVDMKKFLQIHGWMGRLHYANQKKHLSFAHFPSHALQYPVGEAFILSALTAKHLDSLDLIKNTRYSSQEHDMDRLLRMGIHTVIRIPVYFVHTKVMTDVINGLVPFAKINDHYWDLMHKYVGVVEPTDRKANDIDFSHFFYHNIDRNNQARKFMSEVIGYQIYQGLCIESGHKEELHKCDFYGSQKAGNLLKNMMQMGSKKPWQQVLSTVTGNNNGMNINSILEYYAPLRDWIREQNTLNNVTKGWQA